MVLKTPKIKFEQGYSLLELVIAIFILALLFFATMLYVDPLNNRAKARDSRRISDLTTLDRIITEYRLDNGTFPDTESVLRTSNTLPNGSTLALDSIVRGWIDENFSSYGSKLPIDPLNDATYFYSYFYESNAYELNATLEILFDHAVSDGGDSDTVYELGNNLNLITN